MRRLIERKQTITPAGTSLRKARKRAGISMDALALKAKVGVPTICNLERYGIMPGPLPRLRLARTLGIPAAELFPGAPPFPWEEDGESKP
jgi:transcriptional regulator with XRE-family HTH domain